MESTKLCRKKSYLRVSSAYPYI
jgi:hypothetical protein